MVWPKKVALSHRGRLVPAGKRRRKSPRFSSLRMSCERFVTVVTVSSAPAGPGT